MRRRLRLGYLSFDPFWWMDADTRAVEALSAILALIFALILWIPGDLFAERSGYRVMAALLPEGAWGAIFFFQWLLQSMAMCGNVRLLRYPSALCAFLLWLFVGTCFWLVFAYALAPYIFFLVAIFMGWVIWKGPTDGES